jgi:hypothetical protein
MRMTTFRGFLPVLALAAGPLLVSGLTSPAGAATALPGGPLRPGIEGQVAASAKPRGFELVQPEANGKVFCLDAATRGSKAGKVGDPVVLYDCSGNSNQYWYEAPSPGGPDGNFHALHSTRYPKLCLRANGLKNGEVVLLGKCNTTRNEELNIYYFVECTGLEMLPCPLKFAATGPHKIVLVLESKDSAPHSGDLKNGDQILVWTYSSAANRNWLPGPGPL